MGIYDPPPPLYNDPRAGITNSLMQQRGGGGGSFGSGMQQGGGLFGASGGMTPSMPAVLPQQPVPDFGRGASTYNDVFGGASGMGSTRPPPAVTPQQPPPGLQQLQGMLGGGAHGLDPMGAAAAPGAAPFTPQPGAVGMGQMGTGASTWGSWLPAGSAPPPPIRPSSYEV